MLIMNPAVSAKRSDLGDLLILADAAAQDVMAPNAQPLANVAISKERIADLIGAHDAAVSGAEMATYAGVLAKLVQTAQELAALPLMIEG